MNDFLFICSRLILDERVLKILSVTERHTMVRDLQKKPVEFLRVVPEKEAYFQESYSTFNHNLSYYACAAFKWFFQLQENI